jgi:hypothetical protein
MRSVRCGSQLTPQNFTNVGFWQLISELNVLGTLVTCEILLAVFGHGILGQHTVVSYHKHLDGLALHGVWNTDGGALNHTGAKRNDILEF